MNCSAIRVSSVGGATVAPVRREARSRRSATPEQLAGGRRFASESRVEHAYRTLWISDVHLGTRGCKARQLVRFLDAHSCERLFLVGDIFDGWRLGRGWFWDGAQTEVVQRVLAWVQAGVRVTYVSGNHDDALRSRALGRGPLELAGIEVLDEVTHTGADGRRFLVTHGDQFDRVVSHSLWVAKLGDMACAAAEALNKIANACWRSVGFPYWSLSGYLKERVKQAVAYTSDFEDAVMDAARARVVDGVICGHVHRADLRTVEGLVYANDGDWVESCTALGERFDGTLELITWERPEIERFERTVRTES